MITLLSRLFGFLQHFQLFFLGFLWEVYRFFWDGSSVGLANLVESDAGPSSLKPPA